MTIPDRVEAAVRDLRLAGARLVVAVSGGADSVALLRALAEIRRRYQLELVVGHFNHRWRGPASDRDAEFVAALSRDLRIPFHLGMASTSTSPQAASEEDARNERYAFLATLAQRESASAIATAHHRDDDIETILFHLIRGTSWRGLSGIPSERRLENGVRLVRPLLSVSRAEVLQWLRGLGQAWQVDDTNHSLDFTRNRIRSVLIPELSAINPGFGESLLRLAAQAEEIHTDLTQRAAELLNHATVPTPPRNQTGSAASRRLFVLRRAPLVSAPPLLRREVLALVWRQSGLPLVAMTSEHWDRLARLLEVMGTDNLPGDIRFEVTTTEVRVSRQSNNDNSPPER
jgi:tRNA(Ile)-lysidine synthase